jgi:catechol 2,3-dioxygenase-like lactoylglutathione lyase family enzyme
MKIKSVSGLTCYVGNLEKTARFYKTLGFDHKKRDPHHMPVYSNWFWIDFRSIDKEENPEFRKAASLKNKGAGLHVYLSVDDVDAFHRGLLSKGLKPAGKPEAQPWGNREFVIRDPDGYKLVIFKRN